MHVNGDLISEAASFKQLPVIPISFRQLLQLLHTRSSSAYHGGIAEQLGTQTYA